MRITKFGPLPKVAFVADVPLDEDGRLHAQAVVKVVEDLHNAQALIHKYDPKAGCFTDLSTEIVTLNPATSEPQPPAKALRVTCRWQASMHLADNLAKMLPGFQRATG